MHGGRWRRADRWHRMQRLEMNSTCPRSKAGKTSTAGTTREHQAPRDARTSPAAALATRASPSVSGLAAQKRRFRKAPAPAACRRPRRDDGRKSCTRRRRGMPLHRRQGAAGGARGYNAQRRAHASCLARSAQGGPDSPPSPPARAQLAGPAATARPASNRSDARSAASAAGAAAPTPSPRYVPPVARRMRTTPARPRSAADGISGETSPAAAAGRAPRPRPPPRSGECASRDSRTFDEERLGAGAEARSGAFPPPHDASVAGRSRRS